MHYKNGREAKAGDQVINVDTGNTGILYDTKPNAKTCDGRLAAKSAYDPLITISHCLHVDDVRLAQVPDSTVKT